MYLLKGKCYNNILVVFVVLHINERNINLVTKRVLNIKFYKLNMPIGAFLADIINFIIMALVIFLIVKGVNKVSALGKKKQEEEEEVTTKVCPFCCSEIPLAACKCPNCTSDLPAEEKAKDEPAKAEEPAKVKVGNKKRR